VVGQFDLSVSGNFTSRDIGYSKATFLPPAFDGATSFGWVGGIMHSWGRVIIFYIYRPERQGRQPVRIPVRN
jgi:hypothetical protein